MYKKLEKCLKSIRKKTDFKPEKAVILGSGLGDYAEKIQIEKIVKYTDIEDFPVSTVQGHKGQFVFGYVKDVPVVLMQEECIIMKVLHAGCCTPDQTDGDDGSKEDSSD